MQKSYSYFFMLSLLLAAPAAWAQKSFQPGYIVRAAGDTLRGEIDARGAQRMTRSCMFRTGPDAAPTEYLPTTLKGYGLRQGAQYEALQVPTGPVLQNAPQPVAAAPVVFMQVLAQGKAELFSFPDAEDRIHYCFRMASQPLTELIQIKQVAVIRGRRVMVEQYPFRDVLRAAFADCPAVQPLIAKTQLADMKLIKLFIGYNTCGPNAPASRQVAVRTSKLQLGLVGGMQQGSSFFSSRNEDVAFQSSLRPVFGLGFLLKPALLNKNLALRIELNYQKQHYQTTHNFINVLNGLPTERTSLMDITSLRIPFMLRYTWPKGFVRPYLQVGIETSVLLNGDARFYTAEQQIPGEPPVVYTRPIELQKLVFGPVGGLGLLVPTGSLGALQVEARYNPQWGSASHELGLIGAPSTYTFLLGYNFGQ